MRTLKLAFALFGLFTLLFVSTADAKRLINKGAKKDGRWARPKVVKYYKNAGRSASIRVHKVRKSRSGKSLQVAVSNKNSGKVDLYNVNRRTGKVSATRTGLYKQSTARGQSNLKLRRERAPLKGTFSGVNSSGLSRSGKSYRINSNTDRNERTYVNVKNGALRRYDRGLK